MIREIQQKSPRGTLVYFHGLGESGLCFENLMKSPVLADWNHLCIDMPGYGKSPWFPEVFSLDQLARLIRDILSEVLEECPVILGHSMGGVLGQIYTEMFADDVRGFINVEGNLSSDDCVFSGQAVAGSRDTFITHRFQQLQNRVYEAGGTEPAQRGYYCSLRLTDPRQYYQNSRDLVAFAGKEDGAARFAALEGHRLYVAGSPRGVSERSLALLRLANAPFTVIENAGHWPFVDHPDAFSNQVIAFLNQLT